MSGYDVCRRVRTGDAIVDPWDPDLPIIMLSAKAEHTDRVRGLSRGADDYVTNPIQYPEGEARVHWSRAVALRCRDGGDRHRDVVRGCGLWACGSPVLAGLVLC